MCVERSNERSERLLLGTCLWPGHRPNRCAGPIHARLLPATRLTARRMGPCPRGSSSTFFSSPRRSSLVSLSFSAPSQAPLPWSIVVARRPPRPPPPWESADPAVLGQIRLVPRHRSSAYLVRPGHAGAATGHAGLHPRHKFAGSRLQPWSFFATTDEPRCYNLHRFLLQTVTATRRATRFLLQPLLVFATTSDLFCYISDGGRHGITRKSCNPS